MHHHGRLPIALRRRPKRRDQRRVVRGRRPATRVGEKDLNGVAADTLRLL